MSRTVDPRAPTTQPTVRRHRPSRLHENFEVASRMKPYVNRLRLQVAQLDLTDPNSKQRLENARREMTNLLINKKVRKDLARQAVAQALDIAADYQLEALRREQNLKELKRSQSTLERLRTTRCARTRNVQTIAIGKGQAQQNCGGAGLEEFR